MPELPDIQVLKEYLDATSLHQPIKAVEVRSQQMLAGVNARELKDTLQGHAFAGTRRHGKYLFVELDGNGWLVLHFGMTGDLKYYKNPEHEPKYEQILFHFSNGYHLAYIMFRKLGEVRLVDHPEDLIQEKQLGPDVLADDFDFAAFRKILSERRGIGPRRLFLSPMPATMMTMNKERALRSSLGIPSEARKVIIFAETSHWDPNWLYTSQEYYDRFVQKQLDQAVLDVPPRFLPCRGPQASGKRPSPGWMACISPGSSAMIVRSILARARRPNTCRRPARFQPKSNSFQPGTATAPTPDGGSGPWFLLL